MTRRSLAFVLCLLTLDLACAKAPPVTTSTLATTRTLDSLEQLRQDLLNTTRGPGVQRGAWGVVVHSLDRDERLFELNPRTLLVPASAAKIVSVAAAADAVGWDFHYETTLRATGPIVDGIVRGDLLVVGSGDPSIGGRAGSDLVAWIDAIKAAGIRRIEGRVVGDDDALEEPRPQLAWTWDDLGYTTGALFGALNLGENRTFVTVTPGSAPGSPAGVAVPPQAAYRPVANRVVTGAPGSAALVWPEQRPGDPALTIAGSVPAGSGPVVLAIAVGNPTLWFATVLRRQLVNAGIEVAGEAVDVDDVTPAPDRAGPLLYTHRSKALSEIVQPLLKESINLYGEAALRLSAAPGTFPTNDAALEGLRKRLEAWGIAAGDQQLVDGSGLSRRDVITAEALLTVLRRMYVADSASPFMTGQPIAGVDGSLANRMRGTPAEGNVRGKTGTMSNIRSLAGYVTTADGERLAFVVMVNNFEGTGAEAIQAVDGVAVRLAAFRR